MTFFGTVLSCTSSCGPGPMKIPPGPQPSQKSHWLASSVSATCFLIKPDTLKQKIMALPGKYSLRHALGHHQEKQ